MASEAFDLSGTAEGKATRWVRMAQPYGGGQHGMHFPLLKGTEVLWTCIDGDPDRPIIALEHFHSVIRGLAQQAQDLARR